MVCFKEIHVSHRAEQSRERRGPAGSSRMDSTGLQTALERAGHRETTGEQLGHSQLLLSPGSVPVQPRFCPGSAPARPAFRGTRRAQGAAAFVVFVPAEPVPSPPEFSLQRIGAGAAGPARSRSPGGAAGGAGGCGLPQTAGGEVGHGFGEGTRRRFGSRGFQRKPRGANPPPGTRCRWCRWYR